LNSGSDMTQSRMPPAVAGRFLAYTTKEHEDIAIAGTQSSSVSGIVIRDRDPRAAVRRARSAGYQSSVIPDAGVWTRKLATLASPTALQAPDALLQVSLDSWASGLVTAGAGAVLTPSKFVSLADWTALQAVLRAGEETELPQVITLVATDAAMLSPSYVRTFVETVVTSRPMAFVFAAKDGPFNRRHRAAGLRYLMSRRPGSLLMATEPLAATDAYAHGAAGAAIGVGGGTRRPKRPGDQGGGPDAKDFMPGLFLRELWEHRTPGIYADWFANSPSPTCPDCNDRALDVFDKTDTDKRNVLCHNVHAWLAVFNELRVQTPPEQRRWSADEWLTALTAHLTLRPGVGTVGADLLLRQLVELDDPLGRRTTLQGALY